MLKFFCRFFISDQTGVGIYHTYYLWLLREHIIVHVGKNLPTILVAEQDLLGPNVV